MMKLLRTLFGFSGTISRRAYLLIAFVGVLTKHAVDLIVAVGMFHRAWSPLNYLVPLGMPVTLNALSRSDQVFVATMLAISLPFAWVGVAITVKRFRTIGWPAWLTILFFLPVANIVSFAVAAVWPENIEREGAAPQWLRRFVPRDTLGAAVLAIVLSSVVAVICVALGTRALNSYGWGLFAAIPFAEGAIAAILFGVHERRTLGESVSVALLSVVLTLGALLAVALEGGICTVMAAPLALILAFIGALFGHAIQARHGRPAAGMSSLAVLLLAAPAIMGAESVVQREQPVYMVESEIVVNAPPAEVWKHVISFPDLAPPSELIFRLGVSYPERAKIVGWGAHAVRYCEFSTGTFVEPVTTWDAPKILAFRVAHNPEPMRELSPYHSLETSHLHGYLVSRHGEFRLEPLAGGRTRLIGRTWYQHHLWPASYWAVFADGIIHSIHMRVLRHIKQISETAYASSTRSQ